MKINKNTISGKTGKYIYKVSNIIIYMLAITVIIGTVASMLNMPEHIKTLTDFSSESLIEFLKHIINLVIAMEIVHILCHQTLDSVVEVVILAITKTIILTEPHGTELFLSVLAVGILFVVRKFLFVKNIDEDDLG